MVTNIFRKRRKYESMKIAILGSLSRFQIYILRSSEKPLYYNYSSYIER